MGGSLFSSGNLLASTAASLANPSATSLPARCLVNLYRNITLLQVVDGLPDILGYVSITGILPIQGEYTNCWLAVTEYLEEAAWDVGQILQDILLGDEDGH